MSDKKALLMLLKSQNATPSKINSTYTVCNIFNYGDFATTKFCL